MSKHKLVKFSRPHASYVKDDVAGFHPDHANRLVDAGHAEHYTPEKAATAEQKGGKQGAPNQGGQGGQK